MRLHNSEKFYYPTQDIILFSVKAKDIRDADTTGEIAVDLEVEDGEVVSDEEDDDDDCGGGGVVTEKRTSKDETAERCDEKEAPFGFKEAITDKTTFLGTDHAKSEANNCLLKSSYERFCQMSGTRNMKLEGVSCPASQGRKGFYLLHWASA